MLRSLRRRGLQMLGKVPVAKSTSRSWTGFSRLHVLAFCTFSKPFPGH